MKYKMLIVDDKFEFKTQVCAVHVAYISKPFSSKELSQKIAALLEGDNGFLFEAMEESNTLCHDNDRQSFFVNKQPLALTLSEYTILKTFFDTPKKVFSKEELSQILHNKSIGNIDKRGIGTHICQIRKKIALISREEQIETIRSIGYKLI